MDASEEPSYTRNSIRIALSSFSLQTVLENGRLGLLLSNVPPKPVLYALIGVMLFSLPDATVSQATLQTTCGGQSVLQMSRRSSSLTSTERDDFAQIELPTMQEIYGSIRAAEKLHLYMWHDNSQDATAECLSACGCASIAQCLYPSHTISRQQRTMTRTCYRPLPLRLRVGGKLNLIACFFVLKLAYMVAGHPTRSPLLAEGR